MTDSQSAQLEIGRCCVGVGGETGYQKPECKTISLVTICNVVSDNCITNASDAGDDDAAMPMLWMVYNDAQLRVVFAGSCYVKGYVSLFKSSTNEIR